MGDIDAADAFLNRSALRAVGKRVGPGESVRQWLQGQRAGRRGYLVGTDRHVAWVRPRRLFGAKVELRRAGELQGWHAQGQGRAGFLRLSWPEGDWAVDKVLARSAFAFCDHLDRVRTGIRSFEAEPKDPRDEGQRQARVEDLRRKGLLGKDEAEWMRRKPGAR